MQTCHVAIVGASGVVGQEILRIFEERHFPLTALTLLGSENSEGQRLEFRQGRVPVRLLSKEAFAGVDIAIFAASLEASKDYVAYAVQAGATVIDGSAAFRLAPTIPLCVPEVNPEVLQRHQGIIAMPHSITTLVSLILAPLHAASPLTRVLVSTYQGASGLGQQGVQEFDQQLRDLLNFRPAQTEVFPYQLAFNCVPQGGAFLESGYTVEEMAFIQETRKLLQAPDLPVSATVAYIPLVHSHSAAVYVETARPLAASVVRDMLESAPGVEVQDDWQQGLIPQAIHANQQDAVFVGRIRTDIAIPHGLHLWIAADNLRKGTALNAVQIAERLLAERDERSTP